MAKGNLRKWKGSLVLSGASVDETAACWLANKSLDIHLTDESRHQRIQRDQTESFHITILTAPEVKSCACSLKNILSENSEDYFDFIDIGFGHVTHCSSEAWFISVFCPQATMFRENLGLGWKDFHITLGFAFSDVHGIPKDLRCIIYPASNAHSLACLTNLLCNSPQSTLLDGYRTQLAEFMALRALSLDDSQNLPLIRKLVKFLLQEQFFEVANFLGHSLFDRGYIYGLSTLLVCAQQQALSLDLENIVFSRLPCSIQNIKCPLPSHKSSLLVKVLSTLNSERKKKVQEKHSMAVGIDPHTHLMDLYHLPRNFGWVIEGKLAGCAIPTQVEHFRAIHSIGINRIITIHEESLSDGLQTAAAECSILTFHFAVDDRTPPTLKQLHEICKIIKSSDSGCMIHCQGGVGRTATAIIAYLMQENLWSVSVATSFVTDLRKVILTHSQTAELQKWWRVVIEDSTIVECKVKTQIPDMNNINTKMKRKPSVTLPPLILLCGYAASGKSTFAKSLLQAFPGQIVRVNKDEMRKKGECCVVFSNGVRQGKTVIVDCCNLTVEKRKEWIDMAFNPRTWCINFDLDISECRYRIKRRQNHPTIPPGGAGFKILLSMQRQYEPPSKKEGFEELIVLKNEEAVNELLRSWNVDPVIPSLDEETDKLLKFPRTAHAINLGSASRDDKVMLPKDLETFLGSGKTLIIEEKIDGANMGFFFTKDGVLKAQNRSHYVDSEYHAQFKPLDKWMAQHVGQMWDVLQQEEHPSRFILYGEWLYATHSVKYTRLPGWFIAFDIFDKRRGHFLSRQSLAEKLSSTNIPQVPLIHEGSVDSMEVLRGLVYGPSQYTDDQREGIVIRLLSDDRLVHRAKIVREDFIAGNERWNRSSKLEVNELEEGYSYY